MGERETYTELTLRQHRNAHSISRRTVDDTDVVCPSFLRREFNLENCSHEINFLCFYACDIEEITRTQQGRNLSMFKHLRVSVSVVDDLNQF